MLLEVSQAKYEEKAGHNKRKELKKNIKEYIHDIKYYLKQIGIYLNDNRLEEIRSVWKNCKSVYIWEERKCHLRKSFFEFYFSRFQRGG